MTQKTKQFDVKSNSELLIFFSTLFVANFQDLPFAVQTRLTNLMATLKIRIAPSNL